MASNTLQPISMANGYKRLTVCAPLHSTKNPVVTLQPWAFWQKRPFKQPIRAVTHRLISTAFGDRNLRQNLRCFIFLSRKKTVKRAIMALPNDTAATLRVGPAILAKPTGDGSLRGLLFVAKDLFAVAGHHTAAGSPERLTDPFLATVNADAINRLLANGATLIGIAHQDELAYSLMGQNARFPNPTNPRAPGSITGGSSSGSAAAVASNLVPFSLGSDTGGSVRVPASYCGVASVRPTHGRVSMQDVVPLAPSLDTVGWFANTPKLLADVGHILLDGAAFSPNFTIIRVPSDVLALVNDDVAHATWTYAAHVAKTLDLSLDDTPLATTNDLGAYAAAFVTVQGFEIWQSHGPWITSQNPTLGAGTAQRIAAASQVTREQHAAALTVRQACTNDVTAYLHNALMLMPAAVSRAPSTLLDADAQLRLRTRLLQLTSPAGLTGVPCVTVDVTPDEAYPIGVSFVGPANSDEALLQLVSQLAAVIL